MNYDKTNSRPVRIGRLLAKGRSSNGQLVKMKKFN